MWFEMEKNTKILLIVCVTLFVGLGLIIGLFIEMQSNTPQVLTTTNNTTLKQNTVNNTTGNIQSNQKNTISASQATAIANKYAAKFNFTASGIINYIDAPARGLPGNPYWKVDLKNKDPNGDPKREYVFIDAVTGKVKN